MPTIKAIIETTPDKMDACYVVIPFDVKLEFGSGKPKIIAVFDGKVIYRGILARYGTPYHFLLLTKDVRAKLGKSTGDEVEVAIELDTKERIVEIPALLQKVFKEEEEIHQFFNSLSYTNRKEYAEYIQSAKKKETQVKRLDKVVANLKLSKKTL